MQIVSVVDPNKNNIAPIIISHVNSCETTLVKNIVFLALLTSHVLVLRNSN